MKSLNVKFCFEIYLFKNSVYGFEVEFPKSLGFIILDEKTSFNETGLFIGSLLAFNYLSLDSKFVEHLFIEEELALVGGLQFEKSGVMIGPSCCADMQDWKETVNEIIDHHSPWMGHDPSPWFEFKNSDIILWSDEKDISNLYSIQTFQEEFENSIKIAENQLKKFLTNFEKWATKYYPSNPQKLCDGIRNYLRA